MKAKAKKKDIQFILDWSDHSRDEQLVKVSKFEDGIKTSEVIAVLPSDADLSQETFKTLFDK